jgi:hypothetical protein
VLRPVKHQSRQQTVAATHNPPPNFFVFINLCLAVFWAFEFYSKRLIPWQAAILHAVSALAIFLAARQDIKLTKRPLSRVQLCAWHGIWLSVLLIWNAAAFANFIAQSKWGSPLGVSLLYEFLQDRQNREDFLSQIARTDRVFWGLLCVLILWLAYRVYVWAFCGERVIWLMRSLERLERPLLLCSLAIYGVTAAASPKLLRDEPILAFMSIFPDRPDARNVNSYRSETDRLDNLVRANFHSNLTRPNTNVIVIVLDSLRADRLPFYGFP